MKLDYISLSTQANQMLLLGRTEDAINLLKYGLNQATKYKNQSFVEFYSGELHDIDKNHEIAICCKKTAVQLTKKKNIKLFF